MFESSLLGNGVSCYTTLVHSPIRPFSIVNVKIFYLENTIFQLTVKNCNSYRNRSRERSVMNLKKGDLNFLLLPWSFCIRTESSTFISLCIYNSISMVRWYVLQELEKSVFHAHHPWKMEWNYIVRKKRWKWNNDMSDINEYITFRMQFHSRITLGK